MVRVAWHLTGATVALDWPVWESLGSGRLWIGKQAVRSRSVPFADEDAAGHKLAWNMRDERCVW